MDKNTITGFVLIALVLIGFSYWSQPSEAERLEATRQDSIARVEKQQAESQAKQKEGTEKLAEKEAAVDSSSIFFAHKQGREESIVLNNGKVSVLLSTKGGTVNGSSVLGYKDQQKNDVGLLNKGENSLTLALAAKTENILLHELYFEAMERSDSTVTMRLTAANGGTLSIRYLLRPNSYMLDMIIESEGLGNYFAPSTKAIDLIWKDKARQQEKGYTFENRYSTLTYRTDEGDTENLSETKDDQEEPKEKVEWIAFKNQFFSAVLIAQENFQNTTLSSKQLEKGSGYLKEYEAQMQTAFDPTGQQPTQMQMYLGPNDFHELRATNKLALDNKELELHKLIDFGWPVVRLINRWFIVYLFGWLSDFGLPMGIVLLLLTLIVKALVYPATRKSYLSSARMRVLKPEVDKINAKYPKPEDALKKQQEMMALYSQYGASPMGGCLPMLIQMPFWIALFNFVPNAIELRGESFLWASDLSAYDDLIRWNKDLWLIGNHISIFCLLFTITNLGNMWVSMRQQQNSMMSPEQEQQMKMMKWMMYLMPLMFFFMFNEYSSGLCYYYFLSGLFSILIMWGLRKFTDDKKLLAQMQAYRAKHANDPKKPGGLAARLEAMQKMAEEQQRKQRK